MFFWDSPAPNAITHKHSPLACGSPGLLSRVALLAAHRWDSSSSCAPVQWMTAPLAHPEDLSHSCHWQTHFVAKLASRGEWEIADGWDEWHEAVYAKQGICPFDTRTLRSQTRRLGANLPGAFGKWPRSRSISPNAHAAQRRAGNMMICLRLHHCEPEPFSPVTRALCRSRLNWKCYLKSDSILELYDSLKWGI